MDVGVHRHRPPYRSLLVRMAGALLLLAAADPALTRAGVGFFAENPPRTKVDKKLERKIERLLDEATEGVEAERKMIQVIVDSVFSFAELGFQESETSRFLTEILRENGFAIETGIGGIPTAWLARWGTGKPVIALVSDIDCIPKASQKPGVGYHDPIIEGAPGHGEGHNSGQAVNIAAALVVKKIMEREGLSGTLVLWPGVAEELVATKAWYVRDGYFDDVDLALFTHVAGVFGTSWGNPRGTGLISVEYTFHGEAAHGAGAPWRGRSALDAVELMDAGWNMLREHLRPDQRSHYVITDGGDQPNVVPSKASVWYYFRELTFPEIVKLRDKGDRIAKGAALMTDTEVSMQVLGAAWPRHFNRPLAEVMQKHITAVGMPSWSAEDQTLAKAVQTEVGSEKREGLKTEVEKLEAPPEKPESGGSDDIGDISWKVPTITLAFPANVPELPGHHWSNAIAMATPIAHKGSTAGAMALGRTMIEILMRPQLVDDMWTYYRDVQTKEQKYEPLIGEKDPPPVWLNQAVMDRYRPELRKFYYDPSRYDTYLEQLGITYPTVREVEQPAASTENAASDPRP